MSRQLAISSVLSVLAMASVALLGAPGTHKADGTATKTQLGAAAAPAHSPSLPGLGR